jgi:hypothetical protein
MVLQQHVSLDIFPNTWHPRSGGSETKQGKVSGLLGAISKGRRGGDSRGSAAPLKPERGRCVELLLGHGRKTTGDGWLPGQPSAMGRGAQASCALNR